MNSLGHRGHSSFFIFWDLYWSVVGKKNFGLTASNHRRGASPPLCMDEGKDSGYDPQSTHGFAQPKATQAGRNIARLPESDAGLKHHPSLPAVSLPLSGTGNSRGWQGEPLVTGLPQEISIHPAAPSTGCELCLY